MGLYAGELLYRSSKGIISMKEYWPFSILGFPFHCCSCMNGKSIDKELESSDAVNGDIQNKSNDQEAFWTTRAYLLTIGLTVVFLAITTADRIIKNVSGNDSVDIGAFIWLQALAPFAQLELLVALTFIKKDSLLFRTLTTPVAKFLGAISMTIYLTHFPIIKYVCFANNNWQPLVWPSADSEWNPDNELVSIIIQKNELPLWGIPIVVGITIPLATIVFYGYEEPIRKFFKK